MRVCGSVSAQAPRSILPRTASTGATPASASRMAGLPMSPAWMTNAEPWGAERASGRSSPCVSEMTPMSRIKLYKARSSLRRHPLVGRSAQRVNAEPEGDIRSAESKGHPPPPSLLQVRFGCSDLDQSSKSELGNTRVGWEGAQCRSLTANKAHTTLAVSCKISSHDLVETRAAAG